MSITNRVPVPASRPPQTIRRQTVTPNATPVAPQPLRPSAVGGPGLTPFYQARENPFRKVVFNVLVALVFIKFGLLHEYIGFTTGYDFHLILILGVMALVGLVMAGTVGRASKIGVTKLWILFGVWLVLACPFSFWVGGSVSFVLTNYLPTTFSLFFLTATVPINFGEMRKLLLAAGYSALFLGVIARKFAVISVGGRAELMFGSIKNSGDLGAFLILCLAFLLYLWVESKNWLVRIAVLLAAGSNVWISLSTASRSALIGLAAVGLFLLIWGSGKMRVVFLVGAILTTLMAAAFLPGVVVARLSTLWTSEDVSQSAAAAEAEGSGEMRQMIMQRALKYTLQHPILGVGPDAFPDYDAVMTRRAHQRAVWLETHNAYLQISTEAGIPALLFLVGSMIAAFRGLSRIHRQGRSSPNAKARQYASAAFTLMMAIVIVASFSLFLSHGYSFWIPLILGLSTGLILVAQQDKGLQLAPRPVGAHVAIPRSPALAAMKPPRIA